MQDFLHYCVYPLIVAGVVALGATAVRLPKVFAMIAAPIIVFGFLILGVVMGYEFGVTQASDAIPYTDTNVQAIRQAVEATYVPAWVVIGIFGLLALTGLFMAISKNIHGADIFEVQKPESKEITVVKPAE